MRHPVHYRRFHSLHVDLVAVALTALLGWFIWPSVPPRRASPILPGPSVAYGSVDPRTSGSPLYPGHFAFSSPIGFGASTASRPSPLPRWSVGAMLPFTPALMRAAPKPSIPGGSGASVPPLPALGPVLQRPPERAPRQTLMDIEVDPVLRARAFVLPPVTATALAPTNQAVGDVRAYVQLTSEGSVEHVLFPPGSGMAWNHLRAVEALLLRASANKADTSASGWVRIRWHIASSP